MQILQTPFVPIPSTQFPHTLSSSNATSSRLSLLPKLTAISLTQHIAPPSLFIRCGGGPRTYPGGVSKWQWKRMQSKKSKQLLKARLARERSIYEMRKRAELKAAVSNLERPWEIVQSSPSSSSSSLFSVSADEQLKVLADRFQKPGGFDLWSDNDGPQVFNRDDAGDDLPSSRFFPKGVVHSVKPYGKVGASNSGRSNDGANPTRLTSEDPKVKAKYGTRLRVENSRLNGDNVNGQTFDAKQGKVKGGSISGNRNARKVGRTPKNKRGQNSGKLRDEGVYDMSLQGDGRYGFSESDND